jgi:hypothetical protein
MGLANFSTLRLFAFALILGCSVACAVAQETNPRDTCQGPQLLLLRNGQIIEGSLTRSSDTVVLTTSGGSRLVFQKNDVEAVCDSPDDAYWHKAAQIKASDLEGQKKLFHWCLSQRLPQYAQNQIDILSMMDLKATELEYLHRQLTVALDSRNEENRTIQPDQLVAGNAAGKVASAANSPGNASFSTGPLATDEFPLIRPLPAFDEAASPWQLKPLIANVQPPSPPDLMAQPAESEFAQVGFNEEVPSSRMPIAESADVVDASDVSIEELDRLTDSLPKPAVAMFKHKIEPLLTRSCFAGGCHQDSDTVMPLVRVGSGQLIPRRLSQRNLYSIIKYADPNEPLASPLLTAAMTSHGGLTDPIIAPSSKQFENLATWLIMISNKPNSMHQMPEPDLATRPESAPPADAGLRETGEPVLPGDPDAMRGKAPENDGNTNPHDPEIFNRQFRDDG